MAQYKALLSGRSPAVLARGDFHVCAADRDRDCFDKHRTVSKIGLREIFELCGARFSWFYCDRFHDVVSFIKPLGGSIAALLRLQSRQAQTQISFVIL